MWKASEVLLAVVSRVTASIVFQGLHGRSRNRFLIFCSTFPDSVTSLSPSCFLRCSFVVLRFCFPNCLLLFLEFSVLVSRISISSCVFDLTTFLSFCATKSQILRLAHPLDLEPVLVGGCRLGVRGGRAVIGHAFG